MLKTKQNIADLGTLQQVQKLYIKLLFCIRVRKEFANHPEKTLTNYNIPNYYLKFFPDVASESFQVECRGRAFFVASQVFRCFPKTIACLFSDVKDANQLAKTELFHNFLSSDNFFKPELTIPNTHGIGRGYENRSKFFLWLRNTMGLNENPDLIELRNTAYGEFCGNLTFGADTATESFFHQFTNGIFWKKIPHQNLPIRFLSSDMKILEFNNDSEVNTLVEFGIPDVDQVLGCIV